MLIAFSIIKLIITILELFNNCKTHNSLFKKLAKIMTKNIKIALGIGGNIGNVEENIHLACELLQKNGLENLVLSKLIETEPVGCPEGTANFLNGAITGFWCDSLFNLFELCKTIEEKLGRPRVHDRWVSRTIDLDILLFGDDFCSIITKKGDEIIIPHVELCNRLFVLEPLAEIAGDWILPQKNISVRKYLENILKN